MSTVSPPVDAERPSAAALRDRRITVAGATAQYLEAGSGPPVLLVHGHEQSATSWRWVIPALARTHRVLAVSLPGYGDTAPGAHAPGSDTTPFVSEFLDALGIATCDLVGPSAGGAVALRLAVARPDRVRTLTLVDSAGLGREVHPLLAVDTLPLVGELAIMLSRLPGGAMGRTTMSAAMLFAQPWRVPAQFFTEQHDQARRPGQLEASTAMARALFSSTGQRQILLDRLPSITAPTLVVWGGCDYVLPVSQAQVAVNLLPNGRLAVLPDCGHLPHIESPARFTDVLGSWLAEHRDLSPEGPQQSDPVQHAPIPTSLLPRSS
jgi:4,5:9,10-diseco-3-hydroxy-5,9,17-trioxoandrosta-1(10),2-diene-4-oate hydrolase